MSTLPALPDELIARVLAFAAPQRRNFAERVDEPSADAACSFLARAVRGDAFYEQRAALMQTCSFCGAEAYATCERCRVVSICDAKACAALYARHAAADQTENGAEDQTVDGAERASGAVTPATLIVVVRDRVAAVGEETHGEDTFFKLKGTTRIDKVFQAYAKRKGTALGGLRFRLPGGRDLEADDTPSSLGLEDQAVIDCFDARKTGSCAKLAEERERLRRGDDVVDVRVKLVSVGAIPRPRLMTEPGPKIMDEFAFMTVLVRADAATTPEEFHWRAAAALREPRDSLVLSCTTTAQLVDSSKSLLSQGDSFFATLKGLAGEPARPASAGAGTSVIRKALEATCVGRRVVEIAHEPLERPSGDEIQRRLAAMRGPLPVGGFDPNGPLVGAPAEGEGDAGLGARLEALAGWAPPPPPRPTGPTRPFLRLSEPPGLPGFMFHSDDGFLVAVDNMETHHPEGAKATDAPVRLDRGGGWRIATRDGAESSDLESIVDRSIVGVGWAEWHGGRPILSGGGATTAADRDAAKTGLVLTLDDDRTLYATTEAGPTGQPAYVVLSGTVRQNGRNGTPPDAWLARSTAVGERRAAARATLAKA